jgi:fused signal recognition particle receptor
LAGDVLVYLVIGIVLAVGLLIALVGFLRAPSRRSLPPSGQSATVEVPPPEVAPQIESAPEIEAPPPSAGRLVRLRSRLSGSQGSLGRGLLVLLSRDTIDEDVWEEVEATLITSDVGVLASQEIVGRLRERVRVLGTRTPQ